MENEKILRQTKTTYFTLGLDLHPAHHSPRPKEEKGAEQSQDHRNMPDG
jgi:hypothetical protein